MALCRLPRNRRDPHGYYAEIGVPPWASPDDIRRAVRRLYRELHPDTGSRPDTNRLQRVKLIAEVLLDPVTRHHYDTTPPGRRLLDKVYRAELGAVEELGDLSAEELDQVLTPTPTTPSRPDWYDYLSVGRHPDDRDKVQGWYRFLTGVAPLVGYRSRIVVLIHDGPAFYHPGTSTLAIPRSWEPSTALALGLFVAEVGASPHMV